MHRIWFVILFAALSACTPRAQLVLAPQPVGNPVVPVFIGTTRTPVSDDGFDNERRYAPTYARYDIAVPPDRQLGDLSWPTGAVDPATQFLVTRKQTYPADSAFRAELGRALRDMPGGRREAIIYVHGFNNTFDEGVLRIAQLAHDFRFPAVAVHYSWASAGNPLGYAYDRDSVLFGRDGLEALIANVRAAGANRVILVAHSVGSLLVMETLRQIAIARPGSVARDFEGVILISPDIDVEVFRSQVARIGKLPQPFGVFISKRDRALSLSARLTGQRNRLGNVSDFKDVADLDITVVDVTGFSSGVGHFTTATSPALIQLFSRSGDLDAAFRGDISGRTGLLPGTVLTVQNLTAIILSPVWRRRSPRNSPFLFPAARGHRRMRFVAFLRENRLFLAAGMLLSFSSSYGQTYFIAIFAGQIMETFDLSHGAWGGIYTVGTTASAIVMIWAGGLTDRFRVRHLGAVIAILLAASCLAMAAVPNAWALILVIFALRFTGQGMMSHLSIVAMARWFVASRGRALAISSMGFAAGQAVLPVVFVALLAVFDWRSLWVVAAGLVLVALPILVWLLSAERTPQFHAESSSSLGMSGRHWQRAEVVRHWMFWLAVPVMLGPPCWGTALFFQQVHLAEVKGWTLVDYVALLPFYTVASISATFAFGWAIDRIGTARLLQFYMLPFAAGFLTLATATSLWGAGLGLVLIGIGTGGQATLPAAFWAEFFGTRYLGSIKALSMSIMVFGSAVGPGLTGVLIDHGMDFPVQALGITAYFLAAAILVSAGIRRARPLLARAA